MQKAQKKTGETKKEEGSKKGQGATESIGTE